VDERDVEGDRDRECLVERDPPLGGFPLPDRRVVDVHAERREARRELLLSPSFAPALDSHLLREHSTRQFRELPFDAAPYS
jgi:hypothetical protein